MFPSWYNFKLQNSLAFFFSFFSAALLSPSFVLAQTQVTLSTATPLLNPVEAQLQTPSEEMLNPLVAQSERQGQRISIEFFANEEPIDSLIILWSPGDTSTITIEAEPFLELTEDLLRFDIQEALQLAVSDGYLPLEALREAGLEVNFDERKLELHLRILPAQNRTSAENLTEDGLPLEARDALRPSSFSGYLNLRGNQEIVWSGPATATLGRQDLRLSLEGAVNYQGWVLEGSGEFTERTNPNFVRGDVRVVRDIPTQAIRYVAGDLSIPTTGYQSNRPMGGVSVARNFSIQPYRVIRPISGTQFVLQNPSRVEVFVNGRLVQTLRLPAGLQDIRQLPLNEGINNVQLVITDEFGRVQRLDLATGLANDLLAPGLDQFSYSFGFPSSNFGGTYSYDWEQPILTLAHRWGIQSNLTMGGYFQGNLNQQLLGWEGVLATGIGNWGWNVALSHEKEIGTDYAFQLAYDYINFGATNPAQRRLGVQLEYRGDRFRTLDQFQSFTNKSFDLSVNYQQKLFWDITANASLNYLVGRNNISDSYQFNLGLSKFFSSGIGINLNFIQGRDSRGREDQRLSLNFSRFFPERRQSITTSTNLSNSSQATSRLTLSATSPITFGGVNSSLSIGETPFNYEVTPRFTYRGHRATLNLSHDLRVPRVGDPSLRNTTRLNFGTALVFAEGRFGWSRPVTNSFVIVVPNEDLKGQLVGVNPVGNSYSAQIDGLGVAVMPELQPYRLSTLRLAAPNLPRGYALESDLYRVLPTYRSGTVVQLQTRTPVSIQGMLRYSDGDIVASQRGAVVAIGGARMQPIFFTTDEAGQILVDGLRPGRFEIRLFTGEEDMIQIEIPENQTGVYELGNLTVIPTYLEEEDE